MASSTCSGQRVTNKRFESFYDTAANFSFYDCAVPVPMRGVIHSARPCASVRKWSNLRSQQVDFEIATDDSILHRRLSNFRRLSLSFIECQKIIGINSRSRAQAELGIMKIAQPFVAEFNAKQISKSRQGVQKNPNLQYVRHISLLMPHFRQSIYPIIH